MHIIMYAGLLSGSSLQTAIRAAGGLDGPVDDVALDIIAQQALHDVCREDCHKNSGEFCRAQGEFVHFS